jgi:hypothetical protein
MQKMKKDAIGGIQRHNQREGKESKNKDIDKEKGHLNYDLVNQQNISYVKSIQEMTDERVKRKVRADAVLVSEFFVSASPEYMKGLTDQDQEKYFETAFDHLKEKYGEENILYATVHKDEATPHMHLGVVPITEDGRLSAKDYFHGKTKIRGIQDDFHKHMTTQGFEIERGEPSEKKHKDVHQFKVDQKKQELEQINIQINNQKETLSMYQSAIKVQQSQEKRESTNPKEELPVKSPETSTIPFKKDRVVIDKADLEDLVDLSNDFRERLYEEQSKNQDLQQKFDHKKEEFNDILAQFKKNQQRLQGFVKDKEAEVEKAKKAMRTKVMKDYREEIKLEVKHEIRGEFKGEIRDLKGKLKRQDDLLKESKNQLLTMAEKAEYQLKHSVSKEKFEEVDFVRSSLLKENSVLKRENKDLQNWKDRMIEWGKKTLQKLPDLAESFFKSAGMKDEASKYREHEMER